MVQHLLISEYRELFPGKSFSDIGKSSISRYRELISVPYSREITLTKSELLYGELVPIETVSPEGTFCDTVQVPSNGGDMELI